MLSSPKEEVTSEFLEDGFTEFLAVKGKKSIAHLFTKENRCGIYIFHFANGEFYVGQAKDVVRRFLQHRITHQDIEYVSFKSVDTASLNDVEKETIYLLEQKKKVLRNISLVSILHGHSDLDELVTPNEQQQWLNYQSADDQSSRFDYPELRSKYTQKFQKLKALEEYEDVLWVLNNYVMGGIPFPVMTEYSFWGVSCQPTRYVYSRINIFWQEVLTIYKEQFQVPDEQGNLVVVDDISVSFHLSKSKLLEYETEEELKQKFPLIEISNYIYKTGGQDQINIDLHIDDVEQFFDSPAFEAVRYFNLQLMRKGRCQSKRYHCFDLADDIFKSDEQFQ